jgi:hypothetical protein
MTARNLPDVADLRAFLDYDPATGEFRWRASGAVAGSLNPGGYLQIKRNHRMLSAHRLAWLMVHGEPVPPEIDHINGDRRDNRISNLRAASRADNQANSKTRRDSLTGIKGVYPNGNRFGAQIWHNGQRHYLGMFATVEEASAARRQAAERLHGEYARHG